MNEKENLEYVLTDFYDTLKTRRSESDIELGKNPDDFERGRNLAYYEMIEILESRCEIYDVNLQIE
ncbi:MAG: hypothetical protein LUG91_10335 [Ruminococcus sp.]|nr:hypothetical protein [Ruminococcus sp.]